MSMPAIQPVILSGGSGTRLWPLSREQYPKQLLPLTGADSLLQATALRLDAWRGKTPVAAPIVVANEEYRFITAEQFRQIGRPCHALILEPAGRNTAPALTVAAHLARREDADSILLVMPADQLIRDPEAFCRVVEEGAELAAAGSVVTFGITPERPETGYGYLRLGEPAPDRRAWRLERYIEKPDAETASRFVLDGRHLWNAGIFMLRASVWLAAVARYAPEIASSCQAAWRGGSPDGPFFRLEPAAFLAAPANSIDYAVMEPLSADRAATTRIMVLPIDIGWSDVGAWDALWQVADKDAAGNFVSGDALLEEVSNSLVISRSRLVACIGLRDAVVVETPDVVLVASRQRAHDVRKIVARLKQTARPEAANHRKRHRPWGYYDSIDCGERFHVKRIVVNPQAALSLQMHHHRAEHWVVVRGTARVTRGEESFLLGENESTLIPLGVRHRLENPGKLPLEMIEVQSGTYLGEDDIVRFMDTYGRLVEPAS
ncbi:MAG: mannose-1-phosphate guanylyltransferase/mannose-6-phosphate isomerase [Bacteroidota bacterium]